MHLILPLHLKWFSLMAIYRKTVELRRITPRHAGPGTLYFSLHGYIYAQATVTTIQTSNQPARLAYNLHQAAGMSMSDAMDYLSGAKAPCAFHITDPLRYATAITIPKTPQLWAYPDPQFTEHAAREAELTRQKLRASYQDLHTRHIAPHLLKRDLHTAYTLRHHTRLHNLHILTRFTSLIQDRQTCCQPPAITTAVIRDLMNLAGYPANA